MTVLPDWEVYSDGELSRAAAAGDRGAFAAIYHRYADRLHDFCIGMLRDRDAAADCVQDVFCSAAARLSQLRDADKLRPWLYAIARNEALRRIKDRRREQVCDDLAEVASADAGPDTLAARNELADLLAQAAGGLSDRDRQVLDLAYRHGLDGSELGAALGVSTATAHRIVSRLRETIERSLGALLVSRRAQADPSACPEIRRILAGWDGQFTILTRKRIARHIESCAVCEQDRRRLVSPAALLGGAPLFIPAPEWLRNRTLSQVQLTSASQSLPLPAGAPRSGGRPPAGPLAYQAAAPGDPDGADNAPDASAGQLPRIVSGVVLLTALLAVAAGLTFVLLQHHQLSVAPAPVNGATTTQTQAPVTTPAKPAANPPPPVPVPSPGQVTTSAPVNDTQPAAPPTPSVAPTQAAPPTPSVAPSQAAPTPTLVTAPPSSPTPPDSTPPLVIGGPTVVPHIPWPPQGDGQPADGGQGGGQFQDGQPQGGAQRQGGQQQTGPPQGGGPSQGGQSHGGAPTQDPQKGGPTLCSQLPALCLFRLPTPTPQRIQ